MAEAALEPTRESDNFIRLTLVLIKGGTKIVQGLFNSIHDPSFLPRILQNNRALLNHLKANKIITHKEMVKLFPSNTTYGESKKFDLTLQLKLLRNICNLTAPRVTGWDKLPNDNDLSLEADLARIKFHRNETYAHTYEMDLTEHEFNDLWPQIEGALLRIVHHYSPGSVDEWRKEIEKRRTAPISSEDRTRTTALLNDLRPQIEGTLGSVDEWQKEIEKSRTTPISSKDRTALLKEFPGIYGKAIVVQGNTIQAQLVEFTAKYQIDEVLPDITQDATNIVWAYRYYDGDKEKYIDDSDDGGEYLAGRRLQHLLRHVDATNVVVIVTCWQGDVYLYLDLFKHINECALELLLSGNLVREEISKQDIPKLLEKFEQKFEKQKQKLALEGYKFMKQAEAERQEPADFDIIHSEVITDRKSTFQAHLAHVTSKDEVELVLAKLKEDSKIDKATYNMLAYMIYIKDKKSYLEEGRDDGENRAGKRLLHLLRASKVEDVVVIVTRWYGGVHIGPDRFRHINACASEVIKMGLDRELITSSRQSSGSGTEQVQTKQGKATGKHM